MLAEGMKLIFMISVVLAVASLAAAQEPTTEPQGLTPPVNQQAALDFLLNDLPQRDVGNVLYEQSVKNCQLAIQARDRAPWKEDVPDEIFLNYVLPYCVVTEHRDEWRENFTKRFWPIVQGCHTSSQAALLLNEGIAKLIKTRMGPKERGRYDSSPMETIQAGYGSPCAVSILLIDACRSVGVPARLVGTPSFSITKEKQPPNHFWVEIWDGQWFPLDAGQSTPLNQGWFLENCAKADPFNPRTCIYAVSYKKTLTRFPVIWDEQIKDISAEDVTYSYIKRVPVRLQVIDREDGVHVYGHVTIMLKGRLIADSNIAEPTVFMLSAGQTYDAVVRAIPGPIKRPRVFTAPAERGWLLSLPVGD